jgi:hypothetical protein
LQGFGLDAEENIYAETGEFKGYTYCKDNYLFLRSDQYGKDFFVIRIELLIYNKLHKNVTVFGEELLVQNFSDRGLNEVQYVTKSATKFICKLIDDFIDRAPIYKFVENGKKYLYHKHAIPY